MSDVVQMVVTPGSGDGHALSTARRLRKALVRRGYQLHIQSFFDLDRLRQWAASCAPTFSYLVGVGGDSTLDAAAVAAVRLGIPFVPVPTGFANVFARTFGHSEQTREVVEAFERGNVRRVDVGYVNRKQIFLTFQTYGMLEDIQQAVEREQAPPNSRLLRHLAYYAMAGRFLFTAPLPAVRVEVDGIMIAEDAVIVAVANVEAYGRYLTLTPSASPLDGLFDVFVIPRTTRLGVWTRLLRLWLRLPGRWEGVVLRRGRRVRVAVGDAAPEDLAVRRRALPLLIPPGSVEAVRAHLAKTDARPAPHAARAPMPVGAARGWQAARIGLKS